MRRAVLLGSYPKDGFTKEFTQRRNSRNSSESNEAVWNLSNDCQKTVGTQRKTENGGVFSGGGRDAGVGDDTPLSLYNKKMWLPICRDLPARISHYCCFVMKKSPLNIYQRQNKLKPYLGTMASESRLRTQAWIRHGCNAFDSKKPTSQPLSFWTEQDVLAYIQLYNLDYASVYGDIVKDESGILSTTGVNRTGCIFCAYGSHLEKDESRFERLKRTHPKQYDYCIGGGQWIDNPEFDPDYDGTPDRFGWVDWNPQKIWVPSKEGLGYARLFDMANEIMEKSGRKVVWRY